MQSLPHLPLAITEPSLACPRCRLGIGDGQNLIDEFFMDIPSVCSGCGISTNAWFAFLAMINNANSFIYDGAARFIGYKTLMFSVDLEPGGLTTVSFEAQGMTAGSRILRLIYTPDGMGVFPLEMHGNNVPIRVRRSHDIVLYGMPMVVQGAAPFICAKKVGVYVSFVEPTAEEYAKSELARAFAALEADEYLEMVIPAIVAVEFTCKRLIRALKASVNLRNEKIEDKDLLTKLVPQIAAAVGVPNLMPEISRKVRRLWGQRDCAAHRGHLHQPYGRQNAATQMAAALFAYRYLQLLRRKAEEGGMLTS